MRVLIVEDDEDFVSALREIFGRLQGPPTIAVVGSRDSAYAHLETDFFDLLLLDLKIPTVDGALDANPVHGRAVFGRSRQVAPGTPVFVLTGSPAEDFIREMLAGQQQVDVWGDGHHIGMVSFLRKIEFEQLEKNLAPFASAVWRLSEVEVNKGNLAFGIEDERLIRIFARRVSGTRCAVSMIGGGLSSAKIVRLKVTGSDGSVIHDTVAKLGSKPEVQDESNRFETHIQRLAPAVTPRKLQTLECGAKARAAIFYGLAKGFDLNGFDVCVQQGPFATKVPTALWDATKPWNDGVAETRRSVREIRRRLLSDEDLQRIVTPYSILWISDFESREIQTRWVCLHGDLHGGNVLVSEHGACVLIDYGDVAEGPASLDPITLELSLLFHPDGPLKDGDWPTGSQARLWGKLDDYIVGCPAADFISSCRHWARQVAGGQREIAASAYAYLVRQLKYEDTDKKLVLELLEGVKDFFFST